MPEISWRHHHARLVLPIVICPGYQSDNPLDSIRIDGLLDTGATGTGIRSDIATDLGLRAKGQRRVFTANGVMMATEYVIRVGFVCGDYRDPGFDSSRQQPYLLEDELIAFELQSGFAWPALVGMDILGRSDLWLTRDGNARLVIA